MRPISSKLLVVLAMLGAGCATGNQLGTGGHGGSGEPSSAGSGGATVSGSGAAGGGQTSSGAGAGGSGGEQTTTAPAGGSGGSGGTTGQGGSPQGGSGGGTTTGTAGAGGGVHTCGDLVLAPGEDCEGDNLDGKTCESLGFLGGTLGCAFDCTFDTSECHKCGNGTVDLALGEECDFDAMGNPLVLTTCMGLGFAGSNKNPGCDATCHYDTTPCLCGNGAIDPGELCDGADFGGKDCTNFGFAGGMLACTPECEILASGCNLCGNGMINGGEACDGADLGGKTCQSLGFTAGALACGAGCMVSTLGCTKCGNGILEPGETCDDGNVANGDGCSAACLPEVLSCDPDGTYAIVQGGPIAYSCCGGLVSVNVSSFLLSADGATILSSPSNPVPLSGSATTCPSGNFSNSGSIPGGCTESYSLTGSFTGPDTWTGQYSVSFTGPDCSCFGGIFGTPCIGQVYSITAQR